MLLLTMNIVDYDYGERLTWLLAEPVDDMVQLMTITAGDYLTAFGGDRI